VDFVRSLISSLADPDPPSGCNIIWVRGLAGSGKSTILNSVAQYFSDLRRRGAFLFWNRDDPLNGDPRRVIRTLASQIAKFNPTFAAKLAKKIETSPDVVTSTLDMQFKHLLEEPLSELAAELDLGPIIIILDALDECGTEQSRKRLLDTLSQGLTRLPNMFRLLIASRDESDIRTALSCLKVDARNAPMGDESTSSDVKLLFQQRLVSNAPAFGHIRLPSNWPGEARIRRLVDLSGGLFIWAMTTILFVESDFPEKRLEKVLSASAHGPSHNQLDDLYRIALTHPFEAYEESDLESVHSILGAIMVAREPLTDEELSQLLGLSIHDVQRVLTRLQSLLRGGHGRPIQVLHASFVDFLCDRWQGSRWHIDPPIHHLKLASGCLRVMQRDLKFNICGIETSSYRNKKIKGIQERVTQVITHVLLYASQYWASHLNSGAVSESDCHVLGEAVMDFMNSRFLYWIEVFSLKDEMWIISAILNTAAIWAAVCHFQSCKTRIDENC